MAGLRCAAGALRWDGSKRMMGEGDVSGSPSGAIAEKGQQRAMLGQVSELSSDWWCCGQMRLFSEQMSLPLREMERVPKGRLLLSEVNLFGLMLVGD